MAFGRFTYAANGNKINEGITEVQAKTASPTEEVDTRNAAKGL